MSRAAVSVTLSFLLAAAACNDAGPPPSTPAAAAAPAPVTTVVVDPGPLVEQRAVASSEPPAAPASAPPAAPASAADAGSADFYSCNADSDCVAVQTAGCCPTGRKTAVNTQSVDAYAASVPCAKAHRICPMYRVLDKRVAVCEATSHKCEMVQPPH